MSQVEYDFQSVKKSRIAYKDFMNVLSNESNQSDQMIHKHQKHQESYSVPTHYGSTHVPSGKVESHPLEKMCPKPVRCKLLDLFQDPPSALILRVEYRATNNNEDRIILFSSNRTGCIGKIIVTSTSVSTAIVSGDDPIQNMAQAKIQNIEIKHSFRGFDLGGLLFSLAMNVIRCKYEGSIRCSLDAEEDVRRHNKLVSFYTGLGCQVKPNAKITYVSSSNGDETYRKVPMHLLLHGTKMDQSSNTLVLDHQHSDNFENQGWNGVFFTPIVLQVGTDSFSPISLDIPSSPVLFNRSHYWLLVEHPNSSLQLRSTLGFVLCVDSNGHVLLEAQASDLAKTSSFFILETFPDEPVESNLELKKASDTYHDSLWKQLWTLRCSISGLYLTTSFFHCRPFDVARCECSLSCHPTPSYWQASTSKTGSLTLTFTKDTPLRRLHYRRFWEKQSVEYVLRMKLRMENQSNHGFISVWDAIKLLRDIPYKPFRIQAMSNSRSVSVRSMCFAIAEAARDEGYPDWFQLIALIHELGRIVSLFDSEIRDDSYDWTVASRARIVGCAPPKTCSFPEYRHLNPEGQLYTTPLGMYNPKCGLMNTLLSWTGPEYLYHTIRRSKTLLCDEALVVLRLFSLGDWHTNNEYTEFENEDDALIHSTVYEFDRLRRRVKRVLFDYEESVESSYNDEVCESLWLRCYEPLVAKYGLTRLPRLT